MSSWTPTTYKTRNWAEYNLSLKRRGSLSIWFDPEMDWEATSSGRRGRQQTYSAAAIQACLTLKVMFSLPLRQTTGFVESLLKLVGLDWSGPTSAPCVGVRRRCPLPYLIPYKGPAGPLHLLVDSTGIKAEGEGEWNARKHGGSKRRLWRKIHIGIDEETLEIRASRSRAAALEMRRCFPTCSIRSLRISCLVASLPMVHNIHANAMVIPPFMGLFETRITRPYSTGSVS